jgi:hypothetical protein
MKTIAAIDIDKPIAVFGSGMSILEMGSDELGDIHQRCFTIFMNYAMCRFGPVEMNMLVWQDWNISYWLANKHLVSGVRLWTTEAAFPFGQPTEIREKIDCWIESSKGNFTLTNVLRDLRKFHPEKAILLFGVDFKVESGENAKWYDVVIEDDKRRRIDKSPHGRCFDTQRRELELIDAGDKIFNCNLDSALEVFPKEDWMEVLGP